MSSRIEGKECTVPTTYNAGPGRVEAWVVQNSPWLALGIIAAAFALRLAYANFCFLNTDEALHFATARQRAGSRPTRHLSEFRTRRSSFWSFMGFLLGRTEADLRLPKPRPAGTVALWLTFARLRHHLQGHPRTRRTGPGCPTFGTRAEWRGVHIDNLIGQGGKPRLEGSRRPPQKLLLPARTSLALVPCSRAPSCGRKRAADHLRPLHQPPAPPSAKRRSFCSGIRPGNFPSKLLQQPFSQGLPASDATASPYPDLRQRLPQFVRRRTLGRRPSECSGEFPGNSIMSASAFITSGTLRVLRATRSRKHPARALVHQCQHAAVFFFRRALLSIDEVVAPHTASSGSGRKPVVPPVALARILPRGLCFCCTFIFSGRETRLYSVFAYMPTSILQHRCDPPVAVAPVFAGQRHDLSCQRIFVRSVDPLVALCPSPLPQQPAGMPLRYPVTLACMPDRATPPLRA